MIVNLYTFNKNSFHSKAFNWVWGVNPTSRFKTMCPYFWSWVATIVFSWIIVPIRLLVPGGKKINTYLLNYKSYSFFSLTAVPICNV